MENLSDSQLYKKCKEYGLNAKHWKQKFAGLLPEVDHRKLHKKRGFQSIHEFAAKLAGMSHNSVDRVLKIANKLEDKPKLLEELTSGTTHWSKIEKVAYVATPETEEEWVKKVKILPRPALEIAVQEARKENGLPPEPINDLNPITFHVSPEVEKQLRVLKNQMEKQTKQTLTWNEAFKQFFQEGLNTQTVTAIVCPECAKRKGESAKTRHIPTDAKRMVEALHGKTCAFRGCKQAAVTLHHTRRFALNQSHDPNYIVPLCKAHNQYVHAGLVDNETDSPSTWRTRNAPDKTHQKFAIDHKTQEYWLA